MKQLTYLSIFLLLFAGCQSQMEFDDVSEMDENILDIERLDGIRHDIAVNVLTSHYGGYRKGEKSTRAATDFTLTPLIIEGDTALYVVQYKEGWEIYSSHKAAKMVLFSSDKGVFDFNDPKMPQALKALIRNNATVVSGMKDAELNEVDASWGGYAFCDKDGDDCTISSRNTDGTFSIINSDDVPPGYWILIGSTPIDESVEISPKVTQTIWDQNSPWNKYSKKVINMNGELVSALSGCVAVAVAQYMYATHYNQGIPKNSVTSALLNSSGNDYTFTGESSTIWDSMAKSRGAYGTENSALLIGKVGHAMQPDYGYDYTWITNRMLLAYLKDVYGVDYVAQDFEMATVKKNIDKGCPVISQAWGKSEKEKDTDDPVGHTFLVDRYLQTTKKTKYIYGRVRYPLPPETIDRWALDFTDEDGNIIEYAYVKEEISEDKSYKISMNWGDSDGMYDRTFHSPYDPWQMGTYSFDLNHKIIVTK